MKKINYVQAANNPVYRPRPYQYREQIIHGRKKNDHQYSIGQILAAYLELNGLSTYSFAKNVTKWGLDNGYGYGVSPTSIWRYIQGICKPKSEIRDLLASYMGVDDAFIAGYRRASSFEALLETRIDTRSAPRVKMVSYPGNKVTTRPGIRMFPDSAA